MHAPGLRGEHVKDFRRIAADEDRHRRVFKTIADALDGGDRLRADLTSQGLAARLEVAEQGGDEMRVLG